MIHKLLKHSPPHDFFNSTFQGQSTSEPKEIGGSSILRGNPNLIKPIPVKPNAQVKPERTKGDHSLGEVFWLLKDQPFTCSA